MAIDDTLRAAGKCAKIKKDGMPCKQSAGHDTEHKGEGCCSKHGGNGGRPAVTGERVGEGKYKRYAVLTSPELRELGEHFAADPDPLNLLPEVLLLRSLIVRFANEYEEFIPALLAWFASFDSDYRKAEALHVAQWIVDVRNAAREELRRSEDTDDDRTLEEIAEDLRLLDRPTPLDHDPRPRKVVDILQVGKFIVDIGSLADKIEKARLNASISLVEVNAHWELIGFELVRGAREVIPDEDLRARLIEVVQRRWDSLPPPGAK